MNSRWQANKIGLINFWYYDEQEFPFVKGRMLLRGSNGSGKSVTMQSVIPLLLDGNMSPERLDPFGSRDRKMSSYLLEEDDGREERTGYLYLEFRRMESDTYLTVGMGIRARRGKPLDKWYFGLTDGRRIGKDFFLYKKTDEKVTLSRKELENRIQGGGQVFDRQADYMEFVNRQVFGFETVEEYKEMIDLLIQLRTPKLSRDFKPSVINDILSDSLQPLSDEDLRPMSEAIENMDTMNMNLKTIQEGKQAAEKINRVLGRYNRLILFEKSENYCQNRKRLSVLEKEAADRERQIRSCEKRVGELESLLTELSADKSAMEKERESLSKSDAVGLKQKELELSDRILGNEKTLREKESQLAAKQDRYLEIENRKKAEQDREWQKEQELYGLLEEMQEEADEMAFQDHAFFSEELKDQFSSAYTFETHEKQFDRTRKEIAEGLSILRETDRYQREAEELFRRREKQQKEADAAWRKVNELETMFVQIQNEWKEALYAWNGRNQELVLPDETMKQLARFAEDYDEKSDFGMVRQAAADVKIAVKGELDALLRKNRGKLSELQEEYEAQKAELHEWENHREPQPPRSEAVLKNRRRLQELQIPYLEFYKVIEFGGGLDQEACDRLEEALLYMGILDALVVEEQYKEQVLSMEKGCCDKYLFVQKNRAEKSILDVLELNDSVNDIFFNRRITGILENIAYDGEGMTSISPQGTYQMGVLTGTVTGEYRAGFLGTKAREQNRQAKIAACLARIDELDQEMELLQKEAEETKRRMERLDAEYEAFPKDGDLREAYRMIEDAERYARRMKDEGLRLEEQFRELSDILKEKKKNALKIAEKLYLTCSYEAFLRADEAAGNYRQHLYQLKSGHELYRQMLSHLHELEERLEQLDADMDEIRYDAGRTEKALKAEQAEYISIQEQLKLTDYEEIKERLDFCIKWLNEYPGKLQNCVEEKVRKREQAENLRLQMETGAAEISECRRKGEYLRKCFEAELALGCVEIPGVVFSEMSGTETDRKEADSARKVYEYLDTDCSGLQKEKIIRDLNEVYFANKGLLNDYQLTQIELFTELDELAQKGDPTAKRMDIQARYQGVKIPFYKLPDYLEAEIASLQDLIRAGDRELFEDILANTVSRKIRAKINGSNGWVEKMNALMSAMNTSSGLKLSLRWRSRTAETEEQLDTKELVELLKKDYRLMREDEASKLSRHFRSKVEEARRHAKESGGMVSFYQVMKETLDYRKWFEFQLFSQKSGERQKELTNSVFGTFSGGEKAMSMYVPLFSAVVAKYQGARSDAPRLISLDEAFAGVDNKNIRDMFRLMTEFQFDFIINSQVLWGDCDTLDALAIYQLIRPENAKFVTVMPYLWNGKAKEMLNNEAELEERSEEFSGEGMS
ncbi:MAG: TIGR02680 family protein [Lachnospiraceae bacterium]|nr:TIGR02680 family protein [Lachnospiraceae bacterium]